MSLVSPLFRTRRRNAPREDLIACGSTSSHWMWSETAEHRFLDAWRKATSQVGYSRIWLWTCYAQDDYVIHGQRVNKKLCYRRRSSRRAMSVKILSTVETSCKTNPQLIEVMELKGYSWPTCSKQPRLVDYCIGLHIAIVNKLDRRRRRRRVLLKTRSTYRGHVFPKFPYNTPRDRWKYVSMTKPSSIRSVVSMQHRLSSYRRTHGDSNYRASIASRGKKKSMLAYVWRRLPVRRNSKCRYAEAARRHIDEEASCQHISGEPSHLDTPRYTLIHLLMSDVTPRKTYTRQ